MTGLTRERRGPLHDPHFRVRLTRAEIPVVARSLTELFERALAVDGALELLAIGFLTAQ